MNARGRFGSPPRMVTARQPARGAASDTLRPQYDPPALPSNRASTGLRHCPSALPSVRARVRLRPCPHASVHPRLCWLAPQPAHASVRPTALLPARAFVCPHLCWSAPIPAYAFVRQRLRSPAPQPARASVQPRPRSPLPPTLPSSRAFVHPTEPLPAFVLARMQLSPPRLRQLAPLPAVPGCPALGSLAASRHGRCGVPRHSRVKVTPVMMNASARILALSTRSPKIAQPSTTANRIEVSRNAPTSAIGASVIAQTAMA